MAKEKVIIDIQTEGGDKAVNDIDKVNKSLKETKETQNELTGALGGGFGAVGQGFSKLKQGLDVAKTGFGSLRAAIISTGIGALLIAFTSLIAFFTKTREGAAILERATAILGVTVSKLTDLASDLGKAIFDAFNNPKEAIMGIGKAIKDFVMNRISDVLDGISGLGSAFGKLFKGDFSGAMEDAKQAAIDLTTGLVPVAGLIKDNADAIMGFVDEVANAVVEVDKLTLASQRLYDQETKDLTIKAKLKKDVAELLALAADQTKSEEDRLAALELAAKKREQLLQIDLKAQAENVRILEANQALGKNLREDDRKLAEEKAKLIDLETAFAAQSKETTAQISGFKKKLADDEEARRLKEKEAKDKELEEERLRLEKEKEYQVKLLEEANVIINDITKTQQEKEIQAIEAQTQKKLEKLQEAGLLTSELSAKLEQDKVNKIKEINDKANKKEVEDKQALEEAKLSLAGDALSVAGDLVTAFQGKSEKAAKRAFQIQKGISIAQTTIDTYKGATAIFASAAANPSTILFPAQPFITAGLAVAAGLANVVKISRQQFQGTGGSSGGSSTSKPSVPRIPSGQNTQTGNLSAGVGGSPSNFQQQQLFGVGSGVIGQDKGMNQRVFVVESDITSTQNKVKTTESIAEFGG